MREDVKFDVFQHTVKGISNDWFVPLGSAFGMSDDVGLPIGGIPRAKELDSLDRRWQDALKRW